MENNNRKFSGVGCAYGALMMILLMFILISVNPGLINWENKYNTHYKKHFPDAAASPLEYYSHDYQLKHAMRLTQQAMRYNKEIVSEWNAFQAAERAKYPDMGWQHQERNEHNIILEKPNLNSEQQ